MIARRVFGAFVVVAITPIILHAQGGGGGGGGRGPGGRGGPGGGLPSIYTNRSVPLGPVSTAAADAACKMKGHARLVCFADLLKKDLSDSLKNRLQLPYSVADAKRWSNFPPMGYRNRVGPTLAEFSPAQLGVIKAMLKEAAGIAVGEGYDEIEQIMNADDFLKNNTGENGFASGNYQLAFLGTPATAGTWELYFGGHHLAFGTTYKDGTLIGATPSFRGVEPFTTFKENGRDNAPMADERAAFAAMFGALSESELAKAKLSQTFTDIIVGPQRDDNFPATKTGVRVGDLARAKQDLVMKAIRTYVSDIDSPNEKSILEKYKAQLADTYISFSGASTVTVENDYVRIDGPSVWIEFSMQPGRSIPGVHPHSVWRDRKSDYGGNK